ncbi:hypothetical protein SBOR_4932 [Sclerotinia borealis F-4128]|uniref:EF-hand domain-containing protein n=1 Tax=Sclerotinia borealis (strain F-4128) TaxID=1432307 RepID=W9CFN5_SCLBF|nr:hypothetical protein SBOR_4932 [Sclerotinia borealis F-4128]
MASTSQPHSTFPSRLYNNNNNNNNNNIRNPPTNFGPPSQTALALRQQKTTQLERERVEREKLSKDTQQPQGQQPGAPVANLMNTLSDEQKDEINEAFILFDNDKDQRIDYHEFKVALKALGFDLPKPEILTLLTTHGIAPDAAAGPGPRDAIIPPGRLLLTFSSFQSIAGTLISQRDPRDEILRAFALFDIDEKGMITLDDLRRVARELGEGLEEDELVAMIEEFDLEGKGGVGKEEFIQICMG